MAWKGGNSADPMASFANAQTSQTSTASFETIEKSVSGTGSLSATNNETVAFDASGKVTAVNVAEGDTVSKGDVLATIDTLQLTADLRSAQADLASAKATLADLEDAADGSSSSDAQIASAKANVKLKKQAVADAKDDMADAELVAPFDGLVTSESYSVGDAVGSGSTGGGASTGASSGTSTTSTSGITVVGEDSWTVSVSLSADEVDLIATGDQVTFTADDVDEFYGIVTDISQLPSTSSGSATYPVTLTVTGTPDGLFEGVSVTADIIYLRKTDVLTVPTNAITTTDGVSTVTVVADDGSEETRTVTLGDSSGELTEITDGLSEGENVKVTVFAQGNSDSTGTGDQQQFPGGGQFPGDGQFPGGQGGFQQGGNG
jgi:macrolide-specific efflux system membrane fusion protein